MASSQNLKDHAAARSARCVARDIASTFCPANVATCWPAKTVDATDCRPSKLSSSKKQPHQIKQSKALDVLINGTMGEASDGKAVFEDIQEDTFIRFLLNIYVHQSDLIMKL